MIDRSEYIEHTTSDNEYGEGTNTAPVEMAPYATNSWPYEQLPDDDEDPDDGGTHLFDQGEDYEPKLDSIY